MLPSQNQSTVDHRKPPVTLMAGKPEGDRARQGAGQQHPEGFLPVGTQLLPVVQAGQRREQPPGQGEDAQEQEFFTVMRRPRNSSARVSR